MFKTIDKLILASASPRRRDLLDELGLEFSVEVAQVDERTLAAEKPATYVDRVSCAKAKAVSLHFQDAWVLAADTAVVIDETILGKPHDQSEAIAMLHKLSGREHEVWTGFCLCNAAQGVEKSQFVRTKVSFIKLTEALCQAYASTGEPFDKAGAYGIQSVAGFMVQNIRGSYSNVVGLPVAEVVEVLLKYGVIDSV